ncbi:hypothetical protein [Microbacterium sp. YY-01]|uniref:hypothetical protein n=1 Tax=Microbacterium sp. YY-01 TaxID=3421634 RepID=UPI003D1688EE
MTDLSGLTAAELQQLIADAQQAFYALERAQQQEEQDRLDRIRDGIAALDNVLGPVGAEPGIDSIRAVLGHDDQTLAENSGLALRLAFQALEIVTAATADIARSQ